MKRAFTAVDLWEAAESHPLGYQHGLEQVRRLARSLPAAMPDAPPARMVRSVADALATERREAQVRR